MHVLGLVFAGTATEQRAEMVRFLGETLGLAQVTIDGVEADVFELADGSRFAVADPRGMGDTSRSVGLLVENLDNAVAELRAAGVEVGGDPGENAVQRYIHFRAPDGKLYELIENRAAQPG